VSFWQKRPGRIAILERVHKRGGIHNLSVKDIVDYVSAVERLDPQIIADATAELNRNECALGRICGRSNH
jgi:hypothetical protein